MVHLKKQNLKTNPKVCFTNHFLLKLWADNGKIFLFKTGGSSFGSPTSNQGEEELKRTALCNMQQQSSATRALGSESPARALLGQLTAKALEGGTQPPRLAEPGQGWGHFPGYKHCLESCLVLKCGISRCVLTQQRHPDLPDALDSSSAFWNIGGTKHLRYLHQKCSVCSSPPASCPTAADGKKLPTWANLWEY